MQSAKNNSPQNSVTLGQSIPWRLPSVSRLFFALKAQLEISGRLDVADYAKPGAIAGEE
ncbi:MAG: hypothetical protein AAF889_02595 [Cyanobacteria bacterium P01_D01_bin.73]